MNSPKTLGHTPILPDEAPQSGTPPNSISDPQKHLSEVLDALTQYGEKKNITGLGSKINTEFLVNKVYPLLLQQELHKRNIVRRVNSIIAPLSAIRGFSIFPHSQATQEIRFQKRNACLLGLLYTGNNQREFQLIYGYFKEHREMLLKLLGVFEILEAPEKSS